MHVCGQAMATLCVVRLHVSSRLIEGFALYREEPLPVNHSIVGTPPGCRLMRIVRLPRGWRLWNATRDFIYGSYLEIGDNGRIISVTTYEDQGDDVHMVRPSDDEIRQRRA
jgi:hypothetical protein